MATIKNINIAKMWPRQSDFFKSKEWKLIWRLHHSHSQIQRIADKEFKFIAAYKSFIDYAPTGFNLYIHYKSKETGLTVIELLLSDCSWTANWPLEVVKIQDDKIIRSNNFFPRNQKNLALMAKTNWIVFL